MRNIAYSVYPSIYYPEKLSLQDLYSEVSRLAAEVVENGGYPEWAFVGMDVMDIHSLHNSMVPTHYQNIFAGEAPGFITYKLSTPNGNISLKAVPGSAIHLTEDYVMPDFEATTWTPKPEWSSNQIWVNLEGKGLLVRQAYNSDLLAFKRQDTGEWELSSRFELTSWGFLPYEERPRPL